MTDRLDPLSRPPRTSEVHLDADLEELRAALADLRGEIRARTQHPPERAIAERASRALRAPVDALSRVDWMEVFEELRRRFNTLGLVERTGEVDEFGLDEMVLRQLRPLLDFLAERYWRVDLAGLEHVPDAGPCLLVANRSGLLPYDGLLIAHLIERDKPGRGRPRFLLADWLLTLPFAQPHLARVGGVRACRENANRLLRGGHVVVAFPEGAKGATKVFRERYRVQRFGRGGIVRTALAARVPIVPVAVVGGEEAHPILFKVETPARAVGLPFLPVTPTFPALGPLGLLPLPSKWSVRFGEPILLDHLGPEAASDELLVSRLNEDVRARVQEMVDADLHARDSVFG